MAAAANAEDPPPGTRIGVLLPQMPNSHLEKSLRTGLADLGYVETKDLLIEWRPSAQVPEDLSSRASDFVKSNVAVIVAIGSPAARAAFGRIVNYPHCVHDRGCGRGGFRDRGRERRGRPLPPNPVCGFPATGSPVSCFHIGIGAPSDGPHAS